MKKKTCVITGNLSYEEQNRTEKNMVIYPMEEIPYSRMNTHTQNVAIISRILITTNN